MPKAAYIVDVLRTPGGRRRGALAGMHPADLGAVSVDALLARTGIDPAAVDDLIFGCVSQIGEQSSQVARSVVLASSLPQSVPRSPSIASAAPRSRRCISRRRR